MIKVLKMIIDFLGAAFFFWECFGRLRSSLKWYVRVSAGILGSYLLYDGIRRLLDFASK